MDKNQEKMISIFFELFAKSVETVLSQALDSDVCNKIEFLMTSSSDVQDVEELKKDNVIYKFEYATGTCQGKLALLLPEKFVSSIADILMGGSGEEPYKGELTELEINSVSSLFEKVLKDIEGAFKIHYNQDLAFSAKPLLLLKEMPEYVINVAGEPLNFLINNTLTLKEGLSAPVDVLLNSNNLSELINSLGLSVNKPVEKTSMTALNINRLSDVKINITAELGRTRVPIKYALELVRGSLIELDTLNNSDIKVFANGVEFARAQVVAIEDNFGLKITKIVTPEERLEYI